MSYLDRNLLPDEKIIFRTKKHLIIFFFPLVLAIFSGFAFNYMHSNYILVRVEWAPIVITVLWWCTVGLDYWTSEFAVTNKRIMMREGFFTRHANELRITTISQVSVDQTLLGQILDYGIVTLNAFGALDSFPMIARPFAFQRSVQTQLDTMVK